MAVYKQMKIKKKARWPEPYHKRTMLHKSKDPNSDSPFEARKPTFGESVRHYAWSAFAWIIRAIIWPFSKLGRILYEIFWPKSNFQDNGIMGPGYSQWYERHFSWGKLSFVLVVLFIITYFVFLR